MSCTASCAPPVFVPGATVVRRQWAQGDDDNEVGEGRPGMSPKCLLLSLLYLPHLVEGRKHPFEG